MMARKMIEVSHDLRSQRLVLCTRGAALTGMVEEPHAKALCDHARAVRMFLEAGQPKMAGMGLDRYWEVLREASGAETVSEDAADDLRALVDSLWKVL